MGNETEVSYLEYQGKHKGIWSWLLSTDHKRIGLLYLYAVIFFFFVAAVLGLLMRIELIAPGRTIMDPQTYNGMFTIHGIIMIFVIVIPGLAAVFGNFFLPILIGARDVAFPKLNLFSWYLYMTGALLGVAVTVLWKRATRYWLDLLCALQRGVGYQCHMGPHCCIHPGIFINSHWAELYCHNPPDEGTGDEMAEDATCSRGRFMQLHGYRCWQLP